MPVNRAYITPFAADPASAQLYQALSSLASFGDALEKAAGVNAGTSAAQITAPAQSAWSISAANGHFVIQITPPAAAASPVQHQVASALNQNFDANSSSATFTLGIGQTTLDIVDPNLAKFWRMRSRYQGSGWNQWLAYANASGVVALNAGALKTS